MLEGANMDENDKPDGSTAMERLARELMGAVVSCAPTVWCGEHGIGIHGTRPEQDREHARADIERRIADARADDSGVHPWTMYEMAGLREKSAGLDALCRVLNAESADEAVAVARALAEEHCELKELREAGRIVPEGVSWPRYEDGEAVRIGGEVDLSGKPLVVERVELSMSGCVLRGTIDGACGHTKVASHGVLFKRPAPKAVGADGVEVKAGDTVWLAPERRGMAQRGTRESGDTCGLSGVDALDRLAVVYTRDRSGVPIASLDRCQAWCPASWLTHTAPCTDKDGAPIDEGDEVWTEDGCRWKVLGIKSGGHPLQAKCVEGCHRGKRRDLKWTWVSHERPDSWGRLWEDARKVYTAYWGCIGFCCDKCPALVDGKKPSERYDTAGCHTAEQLDLLVRAERLAGVRDDG